MGALALPTVGAVYVDANVVIYRVEMAQPYFDVSRQLWDALDASTQHVVTSELSLLEALVRPIRLRDTALQALFIGILYGIPGLTCSPITR